MKINLRTTSNFAEIKIDEIETTIFYDSVNELEAFITNLLDIASVLSDKTCKNLNDRIKEF